MPVGQNSTLTHAENAVSTGILRHDSDIASGKERNRALFWVLAAAILLFDSMSTYFSRTLTGVVFPYSMIVLFIFLFGLLKFGYPKFQTPIYVKFALYFLILAFSVSVLSLEEFELNRFRSLLGAIVAMAIGYGCFKAAASESHIRRALLFVGGAYAVVCTIAILNIFPALFPVINTLGYRLGEWIYRPEVTTDQNFQIYYLVPIALLLALRNSTFQLLVIFFLAALSAFVLSELQTRSGSLVLGGTLVMAAIVGMRSRRSIDFRLVFVAFLGVVLALVFFDRVILLFENLINRFTVADFDTFERRTSAFLFTFEHFFDTDWWLPQGYEAYRDATGRGKPHSNITAILVETGVIGLIGWIFAFVVPLIALAKRWLQRKTDAVSDIALCGGMSSMIIQLSLNAPLVELVWFWAGAVIAALAREEFIREEVVTSETEVVRPRGRMPTSQRPPAEDSPAPPAIGETPKAPGPRKLEPGRPAPRPAPTPSRTAPQLKKMPMATPRKLSDTPK